MIQVSDVTFAYGSQPPVFESFNWAVTGGEAWSIIGPSGCGKSTLLYLLAGVRHPVSGVIRINEQVVERPRPSTGLILQDHGLLPWSTVEQNARLGLKIRRMYGPDGVHAPTGWNGAGDEAVSYWLERLGIAGLRAKFPGQLSGGQRQRVAIARTLVLQPDLLLLDEPFSALDAPTREDLQNLLTDLRTEQGLTVIIVTHNIEEAVFLGERILVLDEPPNREPHVIENPSAGRVAYRSQPEFLQKAEAVRGLMGERA